jgi:hypothetical protein
MIRLRGGQLFLCGSELAREGVVSVGMFINWTTAFASKLAPTVFCDYREI